MKTLINRMLSSFNVEVHGKNYIKKLQKSAAGKDAFQTQVKHRRKAKVIIDAGANKGWITKQYRELFPEAFIHAFEPMTSFHDEFRQNNKGANNIILCEKALSDSITIAEFFVNKSADTSSLLKSVEIGATSDKSCQTIDKINVSTETIDNYCQQNKISCIDILKLDTQGSELAILKGARELLQTSRIGLIYTEAFFQHQYKDQPLFYDIASFLQPYGYLLEDIYEPYYNEKFLLWCDAIFLPKR